MVTFKLLEESDFRLLYDWLQKPHIKEWWDDGDDTLAKVAQHYSSDPNTTFRFIVKNENSHPVGYIQYYLKPKGIVGIDLFIGQPTLLSKGLGTEIVTTFLEMIAAQLNPVKIIIDPEPENLRAIRCCEMA